MKNIKKRKRQFDTKHTNYTSLTIKYKTLKSKSKYQLRSSVAFYFTIIWQCDYFPKHSINSYANLPIIPDLLSDLRELHNSIKII